MKLGSVKGVGDSAEAKLHAAGIRTAEKLAAVDLRSNRAVPGLSNQHVAHLRANARRLIAARDGSLSHVSGLGPSATRKLKAAGVTTIQNLLALDLRSTPVPGLSNKHIKELRREARYLVP